MVLLSIIEKKSLAELLDEKIVKYLKKLIRNGCRNSKDVPSRATEILWDKIFFGKNHPGSLRRKFNPNRKKIKNLITSVKIETRYSKIDQENDANVKEDWGKWADIYFTRTQYLISKWSNSYLHYESSLASNIISTFN